MNVARVVFCDVRGVLRLTFRSLSLIIPRESFESKLLYTFYLSSLIDQRDCERTTILSISILN